MDARTPWWTDDYDLAQAPAWQRIMREVEDAFAVTGASTPGWDDPHEKLPGDQSSPEDWYSRVSHPERFEIIWARAKAWEDVILRHGWARRSQYRADQLTWAHDAPDPSTPVTVLEPVQPGGGDLVLAWWGGPNSKWTQAIMIGTRNSLVLPFELIPDCSCDACDYGSECLIEAVDSDIIPVLDGSCSVGVKKSRRGGDSWCSTPFSASSGGTHDRRELSEWTEGESHAGPWFPDWTPMPMVEVP
jgi:hypothetical protein